MAVSSTRSITLGFSGDYQADKTAAAATNTSSPGGVVLTTLASGNNTINLPSTSTTGVTIVNSTGNTVQLTLKGIAGDTGIPIHRTDPTSLGLPNSTGTFVINAASSMDVRLFYT
jgi:hypothetical protein